MKVKYCGTGTEPDGSGVAFDSCYDSHIDFLDARDVRGQWGCLVQSTTYPMTVNNILVTNPGYDGICVRGAENISFLGGSINYVPQRGINIRGDVGNFGPCRNIYVGPLYIGNSAGGYPGIGVFNAYNVTCSNPTIENCYTGISLEGGAAYNGHIVESPRFKTGVTVPIYNEADTVTYTNVPGYSKGNVYTQNSAITWTTLTATSIIDGSGVGSVIIPPESMINKGMGIKIQASGLQTTVTGQTISVLITLGGTTILSIPTMSLVATAQPWKFEAYIYTLADGIVTTTGRFDTVVGAAIKGGMKTTTTSGLNFWVNQTLDVTISVNNSGASSITSNLITVEIV
jgi:hypothetical protein